MSAYRYEYEGEDRNGMPIYSCTRDGAGICGYGPTHRDALCDFLDKEDELVPTREIKIYPGSNEEPADYKTVRAPHNED